MKRFALITLLLATTARSPAPIVYGNLQTVTSNAVPSNLTSVTFKPRNTPLSTVSGDAIILDYTSKTNIWPGGYVTNWLNGGMYDILFTASKSIALLVPTNGGPYTLSYCAQLATNAPAFSYPALVGLPSSYILAGNGIRITTNNPGQLSETVTISTNFNIGFPRVVAGGVTNFNAANGQRFVSTVFASITNAILLTFISVNNNFATIYYRSSEVQEGVGFNVRSSNGLEANSFSWTIVKLQ